MKKSLYLRFVEFCRSNNILLEKGRILVGCSGGVDSTVLCHLLKRSSAEFGIAHVNFGLRGKESQDDELFVRDLARNLQVNYFNFNAETEKFAKENGISIQMAARDLRYRYFEDIADSEQYHYIFTAHHANDNAETVLLNLSRGSWFTQGIPIRNGIVIRPMLFATKNEILEYAREYDISFREDSSNKSDKYQRNAIRHHVIPAIEKVNSSFTHTVFTSTRWASEVAETLNKYAKAAFSKIQKNQNDKILIGKADWQNEGINAVLAYEFLKDFGFSISQVEDLIENFQSSESRIFTSATHRMISDRNLLTLTSIGMTEEFEEVIVSEVPAEIHIGKIQLNLMLTGKKESGDFKDSKTVFLDYNKIKFPLIVRRWRHGDRFVPLGMTNSKLISDFLIDEKASVVEKENQIIVETAGEIVWIAGRRISEHFKLNEETNEVLQLSISS